MKVNLLANEYIAPIIVVVLCVVLVLVIYLIGKGRKGIGHYFVKDSLMTKTEMEYYRVFQAYFGDRYIILPQINLASVIDKEESGYRTELFRNVDFGVFDYNYRPILLIEINDGTHLRPDRQERDEKVGRILKRAGLPLVTFWTKDGINREKIRKTLQKWLG